MGSIRNNASGIGFNYMKGNVQKYLFIMPGINLNIPDDDLEALRQHPVFNLAYENETIEILLRDPVKTSQLDEFTVVDSRRNGEPLPVFDKPRTTAEPDAPKPEDRIRHLSKAELLEMDGIGEGYATKILSRQPEAGYSSFGELKGANSDLLKLKDDHWEEIRTRLKESE